MSDLSFYDLTYEGPVVQAILDTAQKLRTEGYIFMGAGTPSTVPGTPTERVWYLCGPGTYANFGTSVTVPDGSVMVVSYSNSTWTKVVIAINGGAAVSGWKVVDSVASLPSSPEDPSLGWIVDNIVYLYVGEGGDTLSGKYQSMGDFQGPQGEDGAPGPQGPAGLDGISIGDNWTAFSALSQLDGKTDAQMAEMVPDGLAFREGLLSKETIGATWVDGKGVLTSNGSLQSLTALSYCNYIDISDYDFLYVPTLVLTKTYGYALYDASKTFISGGGYRDTGYASGNFQYYIIPTNGAKFLCATAHAKSSTYYTGYPRIYGMKAAKDVADDLFDELNWYDGKAKTTTWENGYINSAGTEGANSNYCRSGYIPTANLAYIRSTNDTVLSINCYKADGTHIDLFQNYAKFIAEPPIACSYVRIWYAWTTPSTAGNNIEIKTFTQYQKNKQFSLLSGQRCVTFGDSITWYDGHAYNWGKENGKVAVGYQSYMRNCGMVVDNQGASGQDMTQISAIITSYANFADMDICTITSGANDTRKSIPVGTIADIGSTYDTTTFIGALQASIDYALTQNPNIKIALFTPIKGWIYGGGYVPTRQTDGMVDEAYATAIKQVGALYSLPVLDLFNLAGINLLTRNVAMNDPEPPSNTLYSLHPSRYEYRRIADLILPFLSSM